MPEKRTAPRKKFDYYLRVMDDDTQEPLGHMVQLSPDGLQLETSAPIQLQKDYYLRLELMPGLADRPYMVFIGRSKWCNMDPKEPNLYHCGFQILEIMPDDKELFLQILAKYGS